MTIVQLLFIRHPECVAFVELDISPGSTFEDVAGLCEKLEGVTVTAKAMMKAERRVEGAFVPADYRFTGQECDIQFMDFVGAGC